MIGNIKFTDKKLLWLGRILIFYEFFVFIIAALKTSPGQNINFLSIGLSVAVVLGWILPQRIVFPIFWFGFVGSPLYLMLKAEEKVISTVVITILLLCGVFISGMLSEFISDAERINDEEAQSESNGKYFVPSFLAYLFLLTFAVPGEISLDISNVVLGFPLLFCIVYISIHTFCLNFWFYKDTDFLPGATLTSALFVIFVAITKRYAPIFSLQTIFSIVFLTAYISKNYEVAYRDAKAAEEAEEIAEELF